MSVTREDVLKRLEQVPGPDGRTPLPASGALSEIVVQSGKVYFSIAIAGPRAAELEPMRKAAEAAVAAMPGVKGVVASLTAERPQGRATPSQQPRAEPASRRIAVPGVKHIIAVASGKGGVGKSTTACNLALALKTMGLKVGVLDADIYGPSMPKLFHLSGKPQVKDGKTLVPLDGYGIKVMSIGFLIEEEKAIVWRGPMVMSALTQMLREVDWGDLDILVVDMPPGTGDAQLTMAQQVPLSGAVIVSTPQDLALIDARRGVAMFRQVSVPILGLIENMSYFVCDGCGKRHDIFAHGGAKAEAQRQGVPFLGEIPLAPEIRETSDAGRPIVVAAPKGEHAKSYRAAAEAIWQALAAGTGVRPAPRIVIE
jgi:ATP-binding protein involved in chromosome partitioning